MSDYNDALIRALLGFSFTWIVASCFFNHRINLIKMRHAKLIEDLRKDNLRLRAELEVACKHKDLHS